VLDHANDHGDDVSPPLDQNTVAHPDAKPLHLVLVVKGRMTDGDTAQADRLQNRHGCQGAGTADVDAVIDK
jgi:hypothetical protein